MRNTFSVCNYCSCGCGLYLMEKDGRIIGVGPSLNHPVSEGTLCLKGWTSYQYIHSPFRLKQPLIRKGSHLEQASWEDALTAAADGLKSTIQRIGPGAVALFGSGKATTEELLLLKYLGNEALRTPRLYLDTFRPSLSYPALFDGSFLPCGSSDIAACDLLILINSDSKEQHPAFSGQIWKALDKGVRIVSISTRKDSLSGLCTLHLQISPFTESVLLKGLIHLALENQSRRGRAKEGREDLAHMVRDYSPPQVGQVCGVSEGDLRLASQLLDSARAPVFLYPWGGMEVERERAVISDLKSLGAIKGEAGRIAILYPACNSRSAHMLAPESPAPDLSSAKALLLLGEPYGEDREMVLRHRDYLDFIVALDLFLSPTAEIADVILPASSFAEKEGTITNTEGMIQEMNPALAPLEGTKPEADILLQLCSKLGVKPPTWKEIRADAGRLRETSPPGAESKGHTLEPPPPLPDPDQEYPFQFVEDPLTLRWHTDTRIRRTPILAREFFEDYVEMNREDFQDQGLREGVAVRLVGREGETVVKVRPTDKLRRGVLFSSFVHLRGPLRVEKI
jgi:formate dehydrogenase major subunit